MDDGYSVYYLSSYFTHARYISILFHTCNVKFQQKNCHNRLPLYASCKWPLSAHYSPSPQILYLKLALWSLAETTTLHIQRHRPYLHVTTYIWPPPPHHRRNNNIPPPITHTHTHNSRPSSCSTLPPHPQTPPHTITHLPPVAFFLHHLPQPLVLRIQGRLTPVQVGRVRPHLGRKAGEVFQQLRYILSTIAGNQNINTYLIL